MMWMMTMLRDEHNGDSYNDSDAGSENVFHT